MPQAFVPLFSRRPWARGPWAGTCATRISLAALWREGAVRPGHRQRRRRFSWLARAMVCAVVAFAGDRPRTRAGPRRHFAHARRADGLVGPRDTLSLPTWRGAVEAPECRPVATGPGVATRCCTSGRARCTRRGRRTLGGPRTGLAPLLERGPGRGIAGGAAGQYHLRRAAGPPAIAGSRRAREPRGDRGHERGPHQPSGIRADGRDLRAERPRARRGRLLGGELPVLQRSRSTPSPAATRTCSSSAASPGCAGARAGSTSARPRAACTRSGRLGALLPRRDGSSARCSMRRFAFVAALLAPRSPRPRGWGRFPWW